MVLYVFLLYYHLIIISFEIVCHYDICNYNIERTHLIFFMFAVHFSEIFHVKVFLLFFWKSYVPWWPNFRPKKTISNFDS